MKAIILLFALTGSPETLPAGWRVPTTAELPKGGEVEYEMRKESPTKYLVASADFNGDGVEDKALILKSTTFSGESLFVRLSKGRSYEWVKLHEIDWGKEYPQVSVAMGVDVVPPGDHDYLCVETERGCVDWGDGKQPIKTSLPSIAHFKLGSASSMYFWDKSKRMFHHALISD